ncbi:MAG: hypothetical protein HQ577_06205, partial [Dehalococcoidia bacterium]|nr:hypothetical protein [Dehalococcoidia bacterium]
MTTESGGRIAPREGANPELTPEESALVVRIGVFVKMRWLAIVGVLIASLIATQVFHIQFSLVPIYIICVVVTLYNFFFLYQAKHLDAEARSALPEVLAVP